MSVSFRAPAALPPAKKSGIHWTGGWVGHTARLGILQKREISYQHLGLFYHLELRPFASVNHNCLSSRHSGPVEGISARRYEWQKCRPRSAIRCFQLNFQQKLEPMLTKIRRSAWRHQLTDNWIKKENRWRSHFLWFAAVFSQKLGPR